MNTEKRVSTDELRAAAGGVSASTIQRWVREGLLYEGTRANTGRGAGTQAWFPTENLQLVREIQARRQGGASLEQLKRELVAEGLLKPREEPEPRKKPRKRRRR